MKISVSLSDDDVALIDQLAAESGLPSRSAVVQRALARWRDQRLGADYAGAWDEWGGEADAAAWDAAAEAGTR